MHLHTALILYILICEIIFHSFALTKDNLGKNSGTDYYCPEEIYFSRDFGEFRFPETLATTEDIPVKLPCPYGFREEGLEPIVISTIVSVDLNAYKESESGIKRFCRLITNEDGTLSGRWDPATLQDTAVKYCRTTDALRTENSVYKQLLNGSVLTPFSFKQAIPMLHALIYYALTDFSCAQTLIDSISRMLGADELHADDSFEAESYQLFSMIDRYANEANIQPGYRVKVVNSQISVHTAKLPYIGVQGVNNAMDYSSEVGKVKITLPAQAIRMSIEQGVQQPRLKITSFSDDLFFHWKESTPESTTTEKSNIGIGNTSVSDLIGNWRVFSVDLMGAEVYGLTSEFEYIFFADENIAGYQFRCVYWDEKNRTWSSEGMESIQMENSVVCKSSHMTAFSVLIDPVPLPFPGSDYAPINNSVHSHILSVLSSIGSAISIIGLAGTVLTYGLFRVLRKERSNRILLNLSISLLFLHLFSISGSKELWDEKCFAPAILLHYFLHTSLWWMLMEAYHMHQLLISVFVKPESRFITKRSLIAWGIPFIIVVICGAVKPEVYYTGRNDLCVIAAHLNLPLYYIAYLSPAIIILVVNFGVFCRIIKVLYKQTVQQRKQSPVGRVNNKVQNGTQNMDKKDWNNKIADNMKSKTKYIMLSPTQIKGTLTVMVLVGVGWIVGFLAIGPFEIFFKYLFCICNAGQGAMIFLFRVILHPQANRQWRKALLGLTFDAGEVSTTSSTNFSSKDDKKPSFSVSPTFISASNSVENSLTPSNPAAQDLANKLACMMRESSQSHAKPSGAL